MIGNTLESFVRNENLVPSGLRNNSNLLTLLNKYYEKYLNDTIKQRDIRDLDKTTDEFLDEIQLEIAATVPDTFTVDRIKVFKRLVEWYVSRGSLESISLFFRIVFNEYVEIYYPKTDLFVPSSGFWDSGIGAYRDTNGFLSDIKKIRDERFWQDYSYSIRTTHASDQWGEAVQQLVHPAGFIFFGQRLNVILHTDETISPSMQIPNWMDESYVIIYTNVELIEGNDFIQTIDGRPITSEILKVEQIATTLWKITLDTPRAEWNYATFFLTETFSADINSITIDTADDTWFTADRTTGSEDFPSTCLSTTSDTDISQEYLISDEYCGEFSSAWPSLSDRITSTSPVYKISYKKKKSWDWFVNYVEDTTIEIISSLINNNNDRIVIVTNV